jgi:drug/metabolite transporter (DMT)-like permease
MHSDQQPNNFKVILAFAAIYFIWGSTFFGVSIALKSFPPFLLSSLRLIIAGTTLLIWCIITGEQRPRGIDIIKNSICGLFMFVGGVVAVVWAQQYLSSSLASIIITTPFWFIVLDKRQWKFYFSSKWILAGLVTGLIGVILLLGFKQGRVGNGDLEMQAISILIMIAGSAMWVLGALYLKYNPTRTSTYVGTCIQLLAAGIFCFLISMLQNEPQTIILDDIRTDSLISLLYLAIVSTMITFMAFVWLIKIKPPAIVSTYAYVNPVVAVLLGWGIGNEHISTLQLIALAVILCGVLFVNIPKYQGLTTVKT